MTDLFGTRVTNHDGLRRVEYDVDRDVPHPPRNHREGLRREHARDTRDAAFREHRAKHGPLGDDALHVLRAVGYAKRPPTDRELSEHLSRKLGRDLPPGRISARRGDLLAHAPPLVERAEKRRCTGEGAGTTRVSTWRLTEAGEAYLNETEANR